MLHTSVEIYTTVIKTGTSSLYVTKMPVTRITLVADGLKKFVGFWVLFVC